MSDVAQSLAKKISSQGRQPKSHGALRAAFTLGFVLISIVLVVLWFRSYTWRDRMSVPLGDTWFCRIDSDRGKFEYESYGPNMGEMSFSITSVSHSDISDAWKRFTDAPQPGPGKQWRWERWDTGRFFIHIPHWFLIGIALVLASAPWLPWRFSLRTLLIAMTALCVLLGLLVWINAPPRQSDAQRNAIAIYADLMGDAKKLEEGIVANRSTTDDSNFPQEGSLDFAALLKAIDHAIGTRLPTPQMECCRVRSVPIQRSN